MIAEWKTDKPTVYGDYFVTVKGYRDTQVARWCMPPGRNHGWYQDWMGHWEKVDVIAWDHLPTIYKPEEGK